MICPVDILAFGAHPDDVELGAAGTLLKSRAEGKRFGLVDFTQGELGTRGNAELRAKEAQLAAQILGAEFRYNCGFKDGRFVHDEDHLQTLISLLRKARPQIVIANALQDRHPDHGRAAKMVIDACFYSGLAEWNDPEALPAFRPRLLLHYIQFNNLQPDILIDVSGHFKKKMESVLAYSSQFFNPDDSAPETPISSKTFLESLEGRAQDWGKLIGALHAEGFNMTRPPGVQSPFQLS